MRYLFFKKTRMERIIGIDESPLALHSMRVFEFKTDGSASPMSDIRMKESTPHVTADQAQRAFEYFALDAADRSPVAYAEGCLKIIHVVRALYDSLITDNTWSERSKTLFEAVNCGNVVKVTRLEGSKSRHSDLNVKGKSVTVAASNLVVVHVKANAKLYWDRERELHAFAVENNNAVKFTSADPGPFSEYERRFVEAADNENLGNTDVVVRYLDVARGEAVEETVRVYQKFVVESGAQLALVQALYEICVWHYSMQARSLEEWRKSDEKLFHAKQWAEKMNKKLRIVKLLSKLQVVPSRESIIGHMDSMATVLEKKPKKASKFERYYAAMRKEGTLKTRVQLKEMFDQMPLDEKEKYGNPDTRKSSAQPQKKPPVVSPPQTPKDKEAEKSDEDIFSDDDGDEDDDYDVNDPDDGETCPAEFVDDAEKNAPKMSNVDEDVMNKKRKADTSDPLPNKAQKTKSAKPATNDSQKTSGIPKPSKPSRKPTKDVNKTNNGHKIIGKEIVHDLVESDRVHFLWELLSQNMKAMVEAKRSFTSFESTPFEDAYKAFSELEGKPDDDRFRSAKKVLLQTPGIKLCFQMFNLLFGKEEKKPDDMDDLIFG